MTLNQRAAANIAKSYGLEPIIEKGGEGSRGGRVIGHTKSGQPIYAGGGNHEDYSKQDHLDAADAHWNKMREHGKSNDALHHEKQSYKHLGLAKNAPDKKQPEHKERAIDEEFEKKHPIRKALDDKLRDGKIDQSTWLMANVQLTNLIEKAGKGEGSRGGHIIGHTKSGKPVYADKAGSHKDYKDFTSEDHADAESLHIKRSHGHNDKSFLANRSGASHVAGVHDHLASHHREMSLGHQSERFKKMDHESTKDLSDSEKKILETPRKNGYVGFTHTGKRVEVYADSQYAAIKQIREKENVPKSKHHMVTATLAERDGKQVSHVADF